MSVVSRKFRSIPVRTSADTWSEVTKLLAPDESSDAHTELMSVSGVASSLISSESMANAAIVCKGAGPRVRVYCLYGEDAITGDEANEAALQQCPTEEDWEVSLPSPATDLDWVQRSLKKLSQRITARIDTNKHGSDDDRQEESASRPSVNMEAFLRS